MVDSGIALISPSPVISQWWVATVHGTDGASKATLLDPRFRLDVVCVFVLHPWSKQMSSTNLKPMLFLVSSWATAHLMEVVGKFKAVIMSLT